MKKTTLSIIALLSVLGGVAGYSVSGRKSATIYQDNIEALSQNESSAVWKNEETVTSREEKYPGYIRFISHHVVTCKPGGNEECHAREWDAYVDWHHGRN